MRWPAPPRMAFGLERDRSRFGSITHRILLIVRTFSTQADGRFAEKSSRDDGRMALHPDRLMPIEPSARTVARRLYDGVSGLPILSPHGHTDPRWYAEDQPFSDP